MRDLIRSYSRRDVSEVFHSLVRLCHLFHLFHLIDCLDYFSRECAFECRLCIHQRPVIMDGHNVEIFATYPASYPVHYVLVPPCGCAFEGRRLLLAATPPAFL